MTATPQPAPLEKVRAVLASAKAMAALVDELTGAVDCEAEDIGGHRGSLTILREMGPKIAPLIKQLDEAAAYMASAASPAVPEGYWLAPNEPTEEMREAGELGWCEKRNRFLPARARDCYRAMRAAAPLPPAASAWRMDMENAPRAWAVSDKNGEIDIRTVSPTRRAAIVNWLVVACHIQIYATGSDEYIEELWNTFCDEATAHVIEVLIAKVPPPPSQEGR